MELIEAAGGMTSNDHRKGLEGHVLSENFVALRLEFQVANMNVNPKSAVSFNYITIFIYFYLMS